MKMRFLPDVPITNRLEDEFDVSHFVGLIKESINNTSSPFVYGVLGDWGTGKTSTLMLLKEQIEKDFDNKAISVFPIWFNAWQYENETNVIYPLLHAIKDSFAVHFAGESSAIDFENSYKNVVVSTLLALSDVGLRVATKSLVGESIKLEDVSKILTAVRERPDEIEKVMSSWVDEVSNINKAFEKLLYDFATILARDKPFEPQEVRFVIIIDDLDRCLPETSIAVLENIKNYLCAPNSVFVLGLNASIIYQAIQTKYKNTNINGREYLEKLLNFSFYVPEPSPARIEKFCVNQLKQLVDDNTRATYLHWFEEFGRIAKECSFTNPRKIKRVLNRYILLLRDGFEEEGLKPMDSENVVRLLLMAEYFPNLFQLYLSADQKAARDLYNMAFKVEEFESEFGVQITAIYPLLLKMRNLFRVDPTLNSKKHELEKQVQAVFQLTRLV